MRCGLTESLYEVLGQEEDAEEKTETEPIYLWVDYKEMNNTVLWWVQRRRRQYAWHQCLHRVAHGLVAELVIAGSLTLLIGGIDDDNNTASARRERNRPASTRGNVTSTNVATCESRHHH
jgi:hypothetical protein